MSESRYGIDDLLTLMAVLRDPVEGCPWDIKQDWDSIVPHTLEEAYEVADAIERRAFGELPGELGDLLFQVVYYSRFGKEEERFDFHDVVHILTDKMLRRHPHVFPEGTLASRRPPGVSAEQVETHLVNSRWESLKAEERDQRASDGSANSVLDDVPRTRDDATVCWERRVYDLDRLDSVDMIVSSWGRPGIAHVMISFGFGGEDFVVFSVEVRRQRGERFSEIGGFFRQYELAIVASDERDAVRLRSNVRGEQVRLFRIAMPRHTMRSLLLAYVDEANHLHDSPRFYNTITANCSTLIFAMARRIGAGLPLDYRMLVTDRLPDYAFAMGGLWQGFALSELEDKGNIVERAHQAHDDPAFSRQIRRGVPGWETLP